MPDPSHQGRSPSGVLAHVIATRYTNDTEDIATDTLAYLLNTYPPAGRAFVALARRFQPDIQDIVGWRTQDRDPTVDSGIPDLVGTSRGNARHLIVEAKFWAGLTDNQPTTYLRRLPSDQPSILVFLVPDRRQTSVFGEVVRRCQAEPDLIPKGVDHHAHVAVIDGRVLAVVTWRIVVDRLHAALVEAGDDTGLSDLRQLEGFCGYEDSQQILPFTSEELTGNIGQRIIDLTTIITKTTDRLTVLDDVIASTAGYNWASSQHFSGRYFQLRGWECLLHINYFHWANAAATPIWLQITDKSARNGSLDDALNSLREERPPRLFDSGGLLRVPLTIQPGDESDAIVTGLTEQLTALHELFADGPQLRATTEP